MPSEAIKTMKERDYFQKERPTHPNIRSLNKKINNIIQKTKEKWITFLNKCNHKVNVANVGP